MDSKTKLETHQLTLRRRGDEGVPIVFCAACGSVVLDQNSLTELRCYSCGNTAPWDASRFGVRRGLDDIGANDVVHHFQRIACVEPPAEQPVRFSSY